jgi:cytochrome c-type biogenesis protein CcsB
MEGMMDSSFFFGVATIIYILAMVAYVAYLAFKNSAIGTAATIATVTGFLSQTVAFVMRWMEFADISKMGILRSIPLTNLYESLIFFVWCLVLGYLLIEWKYKTRSFGAFITPIAGITLAFISIGGISTEIQPLVPALQSNWLLAHVTMCFISYAAFALSFATAIMYLILSAEDKKGFPYLFWTMTIAVFATALLAMSLDFIFLKIAVKSSQAFVQNVLFKASFRSGSPAVVVASVAVFGAIAFGVWRYGYLLQKLIGSFSLTTDLLEDLTYRLIAVGFPIFTIGGLIFGAIWADQAWGKYWSWDPKETWSLITWFVYAFYLHARHIRGWRGNKIAMLSVLGFGCTVFTYLGVNLLLSGLHSYGGM